MYEKSTWNNNSLLSSLFALIFIQVLLLLYIFLKTLMIEARSQIKNKFSYFYNFAGSIHKSLHGKRNGYI